MADALKFLRAQISMHAMPLPRKVGKGGQLEKRWPIKTLQFLELSPFGRVSRDDGNQMETTPTR